MKSRPAFASFSFAPLNVICLCLIASTHTRAQTTAYAYVPNNGSGTVSVIDTSNSMVVGTMNVGLDPSAVAISPDGQTLYVADANSNTVSVVNVATNTLETNVAVGAFPVALAVAPNSQSVYVANAAANTVSVINAATNTVATTIAVGSDPNGLAVTPNGQTVYVANGISNNLSVINALTKTVVASVATGNSPEGIAVAPDGQRLYVANSTSDFVSVIATASNALLRTIPAGIPGEIAVAPDGLVYASAQSDAVAVINPGTGMVAGFLTVGLVPAGVDVTPDGHELYAINFEDDTVSIINLSTQTVATLSVGDRPQNPESFIGPELIVNNHSGTALEAGSDADLTAAGLGSTYLDFQGGILQATAGFTSERSIVLLGQNSYNPAYGSGGTVDTNGKEVTFSGNIIGVGALTKQGSGTLTLSGANAYAGGTVINGGTLRAASYTALGIGNVLVTGGELALGIGVNAETLSLGGSYVQGFGGGLYLSLHSATVSDKVVMAGPVSLSGGLTINFNGVSTPGFLARLYSYTLLTSSTPVTGAFSSLDEIDKPSNDTATLLYNHDGDNVVLEVSAPTVLFPSNLAGLTANQRAIVTGINNGLVSANPSSDFLELTSALGAIYINAPGAFAGALNQLTTLNFANFSSSTAFNNSSFLISQFDSYLANHRGVDGTFASSSGGLDYSGFSVSNPEVDSGLQSVSSHLLAWNPAPSTGLISDTPALDLGGTDRKESMVESSESQNLWNVFLSGNVVLAQDFSDSTTGISHADTTTGAVQAGVDYKITPHVLVGAMFAYGHTSATLDEFGSTARVDTYSPALYAAYSQGGWYANALGSYGFDNYSQNRTVSLPGFAGTAHSSPEGDQIVGNLDSGYDFHTHGWTFGPTVGVQYGHLDVDGFTETGLPGADLTVNQDEADSLRSHFGGRAAYAFSSASVEFTPHLSAAWQHEFMDQSRGITSQFSDNGAGSFLVKTANPSRDSALVDVGFDAQVNHALTVFTDYVVNAGQSNYFGQSVQAGVKIGF